MKDELTDALTSLVQASGSSNKVQTYLCTVDAVDKEKYTIDCTALNGTGQFLDARLNAIESGGKGSVCFPVIGSTVIVNILEGNEAEAVVIMFSEIESMQVNLNDNYTLEINEDGTGKATFKKLELNFDELVMNDGQNGAMVKLPVLQQEVAKNSMFLTTLKTAISSAVPVPTDGGAAIKAAVTGAIASLQTANLNNAGNDKIKH